MTQACDRCLKPRDTILRGLSKLSVINTDTWKPLSTVLQNAGECHGCGLLRQMIHRCEDVLGIRFQDDHIQVEPPDSKRAHSECRISGRSGRYVIRFGYTDDGRSISHRRSSESETPFRVA